RALTLAGLPSDVPHPAAGAVYDALTGTLRTVSWLLLGLGLTVALTTWLTRNLRPARLVRRLRGPKEPAPAPAQEPTRVQA
ncbi:hypothetical protein GTW63_23035, partial [Streptomyces sp. SID6137]|nr:hypothetical protein [Streptomyces sp. SID6137]